MKKKLAGILMICVLSMALAACGKKEEAPADTASVQAEDTAEQENQNFTDLEAADYQAFAEKIVKAVEEKDIEALADLTAYPVYVSNVEENGGIIADREKFVALGADAVFTEALVKAVTDADLTALEPSMAGIVLGDGTPNITFNFVDGQLGIVGINY